MIHATSGSHKSYPYTRGVTKVIAAPPENKRLASTKVVPKVMGKIFIRTNSATDWNETKTSVLNGSIPTEQDQNEFCSVN